MWDNTFLADLEKYICFKEQKTVHKFSSVFQITLKVDDETDTE